MEPLIISEIKQTVFDALGIVLIVISIGLLRQIVHKTFRLRFTRKQRRKFRQQALSYSRDLSADMKIVVENNGDWWLINKGKDIK